MHQHAPSVRLRSVPSHVLPIPPAMIAKRSETPRPMVSTTLTVANFAAWVYALFVVASHII